MTERGKKHWPEIQRLAQAEFNAENEDKLLRYVMEANRLQTTFGGYREVRIPNE